MATRAVRPGRRLIIFILAIATLYGGVAIGSDWTPKLGLDLQGGTRITLEATDESGEAVTPEKLEEARRIIESRVNANGVAEAEVSTQGNSNIVVEIPGENRKDLVDTVKQTAQLRFRLVACSSASPTSLCAPYLTQSDPEASPSASPSGKGDKNNTGGKGEKGSQGGKNNTGGKGEKGSQGGKNNTGKGRPEESASPSKNRALSGGLLAADKQKGGDKSDGATADPTDAPTASPTTDPTAVPTIDPNAIPKTAVDTEGAPVDDPQQWQDNPGTKWLEKFAEFTCPTGAGDEESVQDVADEPLVTCDEEGVKYLLSSTLIPGTALKDASAGIPQDQVQWVVNLSLDSEGKKAFAEVSSALAGTEKQFAIVLDGTVLSAPVFTQPIPTGKAEISGSFSQASAQALANSLKYGALPLKFTAPVVSEEGPTLAADQLTAGLQAGAFGLGLVLIYCLLYYRGLGLVVLASLGLAAAVTYAVVLIMSTAVGFTLTLPGIAGLIVAVGITADSFVVYFERIRDEMREGKSMRVAVEAGWVRARATCLAADAVSLLAAVVLYIFAIGVVKGFAFALGISTIIDVAVFFWFTHPMVSWLSRFDFFSSGHKLSGLSPDHVGTAPRRQSAPAGGQA